MPRYDFTCDKCGETDEVNRPAYDSRPIMCKCGYEMRQVYRPVGVIFRGPGFYKNDYKK